MKPLFVLLVSVFLFVLFTENGNCGDFEKYRNAYFKIKDSSLVNSCFSDYYGPSNFTSFRICVSDRVYIFFDKFALIPEIVNYEYDNLISESDEWYKKFDSLCDYNSAMLKIKGIQDSFSVNPELSKLGDAINGDLKLFFSKIDDGNHMQAMILYNNNNEGFRNVMINSQCGIFYYFYFKEDSVAKVIAVPFVR